MGDAVQKRRRQGRFAKYLGPVTKAQVAGDDYRLALMALSQHLEQKLGSFFGKGYIAQLVYNQ